MTDFNGFSKQLPVFLHQLTKNNTKEWFQAHKNEYELHVKYPSERFVSVMGKKLKSLRSGINAIPKVNKSLFRINRDIRFSTDKSPYKTNLGILFWEGPGKRMESSGFYFHLEGEVMMLGCGLHIFPKPTLQLFREAVVDKRKGTALEKAAEKVLSKKYQMATRHYKRTPRGFIPSSGFQEEYLLYNGLTARIELPVDDRLFSSDCVDFVFDHFKNMVPIHEWIMKHLMK